MDTNRGRFKRGIDVKQLVRLPLLPGAVRDGVISSLDATATLRNQLRGLLALDLVERHKHEIEEAYLKSTREVRKAEWTLMENHAHILLNKAELLAALPRPPMKNFDVPDDLVNKYNLLSFSPFLNFLRHEREGGPFENCMDRACEHLYGFRENVYKKPRRLKEKLFPVIKKVSKAPTATYESREATKAIAMQVLPEEVVFENFEVGNTYVVNVILKNSGCNSALLRFVRPQDPAFEISLSKKYNTLAPGLSVQLTVSFHCSDKDDRTDEFIVQPGGGKCVSVPIRATQIPPTLQSVIPYSSLQTCFEESPLSSTINCGRCYVGTVNIVQVRVCNTGSTGRFFIMSEVSWYFNTIKDTTMENVLVHKPFYIQPMYFTIGYRKRRKLRVIYAPQWEGSHLSRVFILCDNITMKSVDVMGEAVMFDPDLFVIEGLEKRYNVMIEGDDSAHYSLYLGRVLSYSNTQRTFDIANNSVVETMFGWEVRKSDIPGVNYLHPEYSTIAPGTGSLCPEVKMMFTVTFHSHDLPVGKYAAIFSIYLDCIPKLAILKRHTKWEHEEISELMVRVCLGKIEVWVDIEHPNVCIWPNYLYFSNTPNIWNMMKVYITNYENISITVGWHRPDLKHLVLTPPVVDLAPFSSTFVYVMLQADEVGKYIGVLSAFFIQSLCTYDVMLECDTTINLTSGVSEIRDFGILRKYELKTGIINATFQTNLEVDVELRHLAMLYNRQTLLPHFHRLKSSLFIVQCPNSLIPDKPAEVIIKARTKEEQICIDVFEWRFCKTTAYTTIISDVQELDITLSPLILDIQNPIFVGEVVSYPIKIINHRQMSTSFSWECFFGKEMDLFQISVQPTQDLLPPATSTEVSLTLLPLKQCIFQNLYFSLSIKNREKPLIGMIRGFVRQSLVAFSWLNDGQEVSYKWPQEECDPKERQYPTPETSISEASSDKDCEICFTEGFTSNSSFKSISSSEKLEADIMAYKDPSDTDFVPYDNWPYIGGKYFGADFTDEDLKRDFEAPWTEASLTEYLRCLNQEDLDTFFDSFSQTSMHFTVDTYKVHTQILYISNLSPVPVNYKVKANFFHSEKKPPKMDPFLLGEMVFHDEGLGYDDAPSLERYKWCRRVRSNLGLAIRVKPKAGVILADQVQALTVSVFAVAWGTYFDNISVFVDEHPIFHVPIMVQCQYPPVYFTFAPDTITPLLRFPSIRPNRTRFKEVYLENTCPFLLKIVWTIYLDRKPEADKDCCMPIHRNPDFGLALELYSKKKSDFCKLSLIPYAGVQENVTYTIEPSVTLIPPNSKTQLRITVNSSTVKKEDVDNKAILSGTALGIVYIEDDFWNSEEYFCCFRPDGYGTNPISLKLLTMVEELNFQVINNTQRDAIFKVSTSEIFNMDKEHTSSRTFHIQNCCNSSDSITISVQEPFRITSIETRDGALTDLTQEFVVDSLQTIQVVVLLILNKSILTKINQLKRTYLDQEGPIISELTYGRKGELQNTVHLQLHLLKPVFRFPTEKINFGNSCVMEKKVKYIDVHVENGDQPFKVRITKAEEDIFRVKPLLGLIREGKATRFFIEFAPRECRRYVNVIEFISSTPGSTYPLFVEGVGSLDHKFYT